LLSVCVYPPIVARQRLGKNPSIVAGQRLGRNVTGVTDTHATIEELLDASFAMWRASYQRKQAISSSQNFLFFSLHPPGLVHGVGKHAVEMPGDLVAERTCCALQTVSERAETELRVFRGRVQPSFSLIRRLCTLCVEG
jgi:hypothetical protein